jgi:nitrate reductase delta subunit
MDERRLQFKVISNLMQYPDEGFMKRLPDVEVLAPELPGALREKIETFISFIKSQSPIRLQETYTRAFYTNSKTTLNMAYHQWGNSDKRALALAGLAHVYRQAGYERIGGELPDFLPLMLEFLSTNPEALGIEILRQCLSGFERLSAQLRETAPVYAALFHTLACILGDQAQEDVPRGIGAHEENARRADLTGGTAPEEGEDHGSCS